MSRSDTFDAIIAGAGHNGLTTACYLARAGLRVLVVEKNDWIGGAAVSRSLYDGWTYSNCSYVCSLLRREIVRDLELPRFGLQVIPYEAGATFTEDGDYFAYYSDHDALVREIGRHNPNDVDAYERFSQTVIRQCRFIRPFLLRNAPDPTSLKPRDIEELLYLVGKANDLGSRELGETLRFWTISIGDFLDEHFDNDLMKAHLAGSGIIGTGLGVYSPGTAYVLLHHYMGDVDGAIGAWGFARGGMGSITKAMGASLEEAGGQIVIGSGVDQFIVSDGRVKGVALENGDTYYAPIVASNMDVKRTFLKHVERSALPGDFVTAVERFKTRGSSGKINIALDAVPDFPAAPEGASFMRGDMHCSTSLGELERAYDDWKHGRWSDDPFVEMTQSSAWDPTLAAPGHYFVSCFIQYCPAEVEGGWTPGKRDAFGETVIDQISNYSPNFRDLIAHMEVRTPHEIENEIGLTEGNIFQGELTIDQLFFNRPFPGYGQYRMPVKNLYMCGSSTHPGGGVSAACGANAAREILMDLKRPNTVPDDDFYDE